MWYDFACLFSYAINQSQFVSQDDVSSCCSDRFLRCLVLWSYSGNHIGFCFLVRRKWLEAAERFQEKKQQILCPCLFSQALQEKQTHLFQLGLFHSRGPFLNIWHVPSEHCRHRPHCPSFPLRHRIESVGKILCLLPIRAKHICQNSGTGFNAILGHTLSELLSRHPDVALMEIHLLW